MFNIPVYMVGKDPLPDCRFDIHSFAHHGGELDMYSVVDIEDHQNESGATEQTLIYGGSFVLEPGDTWCYAHDYLHLINPRKNTFPFGTYDQIIAANGEGFVSDLSMETETFESLPSSGDHMTSVIHISLMYRGLKYAIKCSTYEEDPLPYVYDIKLDAPND